MAILTEVSLNQKIGAVVAAQFPRAAMEWFPTAPDEKVCGFIFWEGFEGEAQTDRQKQVWHLLQQQLSEDDQKRIAALFTLTPREAASMREESN